MMKGYQLKQLMEDIDGDSDISIVLFPSFISQIKSMPDDADTRVQCEFNLRLAGRMVDGKFIATVQFAPSAVIETGTHTLLEAKAQKA